MVLESITTHRRGRGVGLVNSVRESFRRRRWGSTLSSMFGPWESLAAELDARQVTELLNDEIWGYRHEDAPVHWLDDPRYCWWSWSLLGPYESDMQGNPV